MKKLMSIKKIFSALFLLLVMVFTFACNNNDDVTIEKVEIQTYGKFEYTIGEEFDPSEYVLLVTYNIGTVSVGLKSDMVDIDLSEIGTAVGTINYTDEHGTRSFTFTVDVKEKNGITSVTLKNAGQSTYTVGDEFNPSGYVITVNYTDNTSKDIEVTSSMVSIDLSKAGNILGVITYTDEAETASLEISVVVNEKVTPTALSVKTEGKKEYCCLVELDLSGYVFEVLYSDGSKKDVILNNSNANITSFTENLTDEKEEVVITINYIEDSVTLKTTITVQNLSEWNYDEIYKPIEERETILEIYNSASDLIPTNVNKDSEDITFLSSSDYSYKYILFWSISNPIVISSNGKITPNEDDEVVTITLEVRGSYVTEKFTFTVNVEGLGPVVFAPFDKTKKQVFAYYYEGTYREITPQDAAKIDVLNYCFATIDGTGKLSVSGLPHISTILSWRREYKLRVVLSIGGGGATGFTEACTNPANRKVFIDSIIDVLKTYKFDGIDVDWEFPKKNTEIEIFTSLIKELKEAMDAYKEGLLLTAALIAGGSVYNVREYYDCTELNKYLDYAHIMTYDLNSLETASHNSNPLAGRTYSAESSIGFYKTCGFDYEKIVIGAAFYGKISELTTPTTATSAVLNKPVTSTTSITYRRIMNEYYGKDGYVTLYDQPCGAYYLTNGTHFITFENVESINTKARLISTYNLGGMMFWDFGSDDENRTLLSGVFNAITRVNNGTI